MDTTHQQETRINVTKTDIKNAENHWKVHVFTDGTNILYERQKIVWPNSKKILDMQYEADMRLSAKLDNTMHIALGKLILQLIKLNNNKAIVRTSTNVLSTCKAHATIKIADVFNVRIDYAFEPAPNPAKVKLATPDDVVCTLSGKNALFCYHILLGDLYKALQCFPVGMDKSLLIIEAFNHPSVPPFSYVAKESIPKLVKHFFEGNNALVNYLDLREQQNSYVGQLYNHLRTVFAKPAGDPAGYSDIGKLIVILVLLNGCKEFMNFNSLPVELFKRLQFSIENFLKKLAEQTGVVDDWMGLLEHVVNGVSDVPMDRFDLTFKSDIEKCAAQLSATPLKALLSTKDLSKNISLYLPKIYTLNDYRILNWNLKNARGVQTDYEKVVKFLSDMVHALPADQQPDFFTFQNVTDSFEFLDKWGDYFPEGNGVHNDTALIMMHGQKWEKLLEFTGNPEVLTGFFMNRESEKSLQIRNLDIKNKDDFASFAQRRIGIMEKLAENYEGDICSIGYFNHRIPDQGARCIDSSSNIMMGKPKNIGDPIPLLMQSVTKEGCFERSSTGKLMQVSGQTLDTLNPGKFLQRGLLPRNAASSASKFVEVYSFQQYPICVFNEAKREYAEISIEEFMRRLEKVIGYEALISKVQDKEHLRELVIDRLSINKFGLMELTIQLRHDLPKAIREQVIANLQEIGAILPQGANPDHCKLMVMPLAQEEENWQKIDNPLTLNFAHILVDKTPRPLYLPSCVINQCLVDLDNILKGSELTRQQKSELNIIFKAIDGKGLDGWLYLERDCIAWEKSRPITSIFSKLNFFSNTENTKYDTDMLLMALAHSWQNMINNPAISNLKTLVVAEQIRQLCAFFDSEINRLQPDMENINALPGEILTLSPKASNAKVAAFEILKVCAQAHPVNVEINERTIEDWKKCPVLVNGVPYCTTDKPNQPQQAGAAIENSRGNPGFGHPRSKSSINFEITVMPIVGVWDSQIWNNNFKAYNPYAQAPIPKMNFND